MKGEVNKMPTNTKPPSTKPVEFKTVDGKIHRGFFLRDANRWKDTERDAWFDDDVVVAWGYVTEQIKGQISLFGGDINGKN